MELERFTWKPFGKDAMDVVVFRDHVERLLWRAGITGNARRFQRIRAIRDCLPAKFREVVHTVKSESQLWEAIEVAYSTSVVDYLKQCSSCGKMGHSSDSCRARKDKPADERCSEDRRSQPPQCTHCKRKGHVEKDCWSKHGRPGAEEKANDSKNRGAGGDVAPASLKSSTTGSSGTRACFRCGKEGHIVKNCPGTASAPVSFVQRGAGSTPFYSIPNVMSADFLDLRPPPRQLGASCLGAITHEIDCKDVPLHYALAQSYCEKEIFEVDKHPVDKPAYVGCLWSLTSTVKGQHLLTVWDTGAAVAVAPKSTMVLTGTD